MVPKRPNEPPALERREMTGEDVELGIKKLRRRIADVQALATGKVACDDAQVTNVEESAANTIREVFGPNSPEAKTNYRFDIWHGGYNLGDDEFDREAKFQAGIPQAVTKLEGLVKTLEEIREDLPSTIGGGRGGLPRKSGGKKVFVVHGRDEAIKQSVARLLETLECEPVILHERPNLGATLVEKFETNAEQADFAVVLLTPDDVGHIGGEPHGASPRARQNVIFELGYFLGRLGRKYVCALYSDGVTLPSDFGGIVYVPLDSSGAWRLTLTREMKAAGLEIDLNKVK
jgi:hypothetical protein